MFNFFVIVLMIPIILAAAGYPKALLYSAIALMITFVLALGFFIGMTLTWMSYSDAAWATYDLKNAMNFVYFGQKYVAYIEGKPLILWLFYLNVLILDFYRDYIFISFFYKFNPILWFFELLTFYIIYTHAKAFIYFTTDHDIEHIKYIPEVIKDKDYYIQKEKKALQDLFDNREK